MRKDLADARKIRVRAVQAATFPALALTGGVAGWRGPGLLDARSGTRAKTSAADFGGSAERFDVRQESWLCGQSAAKPSLGQFPC